MYYIYFYIHFFQTKIWNTLPTHTHIMYCEFTFFVWIIEVFVCSLLFVEARHTPTADKFNKIKRKQTNRQCWSKPNKRIKIPTKLNHIQCCVRTKCHSKGRKMKGFISAFCPLVPFSENISEISFKRKAISRQFG